MFIGFGVAAIIVFPIAYAVFGLIMGLIYAALYKTLSQADLAGSWLS